ncbi:hypothetical protein UFOVP917_18 [uncultured Caudovirales phage]|uniref:Uncharacterized protein n=1 Tax=uncultured Caudovirales phage TaxID=2100421 RepID=A0A6J5PPS5_9CAUD|nr:hypothetical protein UFOVP297_51 [uncultured Caudovirales phage]CAB4171225.1 hypothetical protein UFOVP917_18 [uncultured Caudovirales phage]CAB4182715.1 hypothetical protein UFOVP1094_20 [uncultured Caudovirales phage]CAB4200090.1 hypothetical protein UFOVP1342_20 [uncultured Caudovirales phage]CAB4213522.1 hypothetical protein UFOVP1450_38 [uncultured Caudovirales phage]
MTNYEVFLGFSALVILDGAMLICNATGCLVWLLLAVISLTGMFVSGNRELQK